MNNIKLIAGRVYGLGVGMSALNGVYQENKNLSGMRCVDYYDYSMASICGACMGIWSGVIWPLTAIGRISVGIDNIITISKNN